MKKFLVVIGLAFLGACGQQTPPESAATAPSQAPPPAVTTPPDESAAVGALKEIHQAQTDYFGRNRRYALEFDELIDTHFLREEPTVASTGYEFRMRPSADAASYTVSAIPSASPTTARHLFMDNDGVIHAELGKEATGESPKI